MVTHLPASVCYPSSQLCKPSHSRSQGSSHVLFGPLATLECLSVIHGVVPRTVPNPIFRKVSGISQGSSTPIMPCLIMAIVGWGWGDVGFDSYYATNHLCGASISSFAFWEFRFPSLRNRDKNPYLHLLKNCLEDLLQWPMANAFWKAIASKTWPPLIHTGHLTFTHQQPLEKTFLILTNHLLIL